MCFNLVPIIDVPDGKSAVACRSICPVGLSLCMLNVPASGLGMAVSSWRAWQGLVC